MEKSTTPPLSPKLEKEDKKLTKKIELEIIRKDGKSYFKFKIDSRIEQIYKDQMLEIKESTNWPGLKFYSIPEMTKNEKYTYRLNDFHLFDDYGKSIFQKGFMNIAWLRTVGGEGLVEIKDIISFAELSQCTKQVTQFLKEYFYEYYQEFHLKGSVTIEV